MIETQSTPAAEMGVQAPDPIAAAATAFKTHLAMDEAPVPRPRDEQGQFATTNEEIEAAEETQVEADVESHEAEQQTEETAQEAQPSDIDLPASWPAEQAETWKTLPPQTQAMIAEREGQRDAAVNAKFQEAANLRKAHEAEISEAQTNRNQYAEAIDLVMSLVVPQMPPRSMLDKTSGDYDPDQYHYRKAQYEETVGFLSHHARQRQEIAAQDEVRRFQAINDATKDRFIQNVPDVVDQAKAPAVFQGLMEYALSQGAPAEIFQTPTTALEWNMIWKAEQYDRLQVAKAKVDSDPKPEPRKAAPPIRAGVATPRKAVEQSQRKAAMDRLGREGSVQAGAAVFKNFFKGNL